MSVCNAAKGMENSDSDSDIAMCDGICAWLSGALVSVCNAVKGMENSDSDSGWRICDEDSLLLGLECAIGISSWRGVSMCALLPNF